MFAAPSGAAGFLARHHTAALSAVAAFAGLATAAATASAWYQSIVWVDAAALVLGAVLAAAVSYWHLRHGRLAAVVAATPLPGLLWAAPLSAGASFGLVSVIAYGFGFAVATLYAQRLLDRLLRQAAGEAPWRSAGVMLGLAIALAAVWFWRGDNANAATQAVFDFLATTLSVLLLLPLSVPLLRFDEAFVAEANRARERSGRIFEWLGGAAVPRWGLSLTGIAVVFFALGWFGSSALLRPGWWRYGASFVLVCSVLGVFAGGWREGLGLGLVLALAALTSLWWQSYARVPFGAVAVLEIAVFAGLLAVSAARQMRRWRADPLDIVRRRALEESGEGVFAALGATAATVPSLLHAGRPVITLAILAAGFGGALLFPAVLTAIETLLPQRRSVEDVFHTDRPL